ncbi:hypothetical protein Acr_29g0008660 [Actinidia rufa]|uniref:Reverse transcriptase domain-containing protein n=1 Tax=Actinidia rufa TaxID=165716 RepID=A0A7J0HG84_9ERIC|nr:hypothetical protein Acr_29g0008660 [Actinidia rufa]
MEPRQTVSTELARATIRILISLSELKYCPPPRLWARSSTKEIEQYRLLVARPDFYHNSLAPSVRTTVPIILCTCAAVTYPDQVPVAPCANRVGRGRRQAPSSSLREKSSSESSKTPTRSRRGRSPHRGDHIRARDKSTSQKIQDLDARLDAINTGMNAPVTMDTLIKQTEPPFTERILRARISSKFKLPAQLGIYEGKTDPMDHLDSKADKYIAAEELAEAKRRRREKDDHKRKEPDTRRTDYREETRYKRPDLDPKRSSNRRPRTPPRRPEFILPPLNAPVGQVLSEIKHEEFVKWPGKIKTDPQKRNRNKYCEFHRDHGHNTEEDCFQLKEQIADLIKGDFIVVDCPSPYNAIMGRPTLGGIKAITSTYHLKMKFPTLTGIGETAGDDMGILREEKEQLILEDPRETEETKPLEEVVLISIHPNYPDRQVMIGIELTNELRIALIDFLKKNSDVFAWSQGDVPGIDP